MAWVWLVIDSVHKSQLFARQTASNQQGQQNTAMCTLFIVWRVLLSLHSLQTASSQLTVSQRSAIASIWVAGYHDIASYSHKPKSVGTQWLEHQESGFFLVLVSFPAQSCLWAIAVSGIVGVFTRVCEWECLTPRAKGECHVTHSNSWPEQRLMARVAGSGWNKAFYRHRSVSSSTDPHLQWTYGAPPGFVPSLAHETRPLTQTGTPAWSIAVIFQPVIWHRAMKDEKHCVNLGV